MALYAQTAQKAKAAAFVAAVLADEDGCKAAAQTDSDPYATFALRIKLNRYSHYVVWDNETPYAEGWLYRVPAWDSLDWFHYEESADDPPYAPNKAGPRYNQLRTILGLASILIRDLPREWENDGRLDDQIAFEAEWLAKYGEAFSYNDRHVLRWTAAMWNAMPDANDLAETLYAPFESWQPYASL